MAIATVTENGPARSAAEYTGDNGQVASPDILISDPDLESIWEKVKLGERLSAEDGVKILETDDFSAVGLMADFKKRQSSGDKVYFVLNRHLNPTNICVLSV